MAFYCFTTPRCTNPIFQEFVGILPLQKYFEQYVWVIAWFSGHHWLNISILSFFFSRQCLTGISHRVCWVGFILALRWATLRPHPSASTPVWPWVGNPSSPPPCWPGTPTLGRWVPEEGPASLGADPSSCGSFCWSFSPTKVVSISSLGRGTDGSSKCATQMKWRGDGDLGRTNPRWTTKSYPEG